MADSRKIVFPLLLFGIFFVLIAITGFIQITIIKRNVEGLLRDEGATLFKSIAREIEVNMEYLTLIEKSPSIITPNFLNIMTYDEAIVDDLYSQLTKMAAADASRLPLSNVMVTDRAGNQVFRKGSIKVDRAPINQLLKRESQTVVRMPSNEDQTLFMGIKLPDKLIFFSLTPDELEGLRKKYVMKTVLENEEKRLDVAEINVYNEAGALYLGSDKRPKGVFSVMSPLNSKYFPNYWMEILISNRLATDTVRRTSVNFVILLVFLMLGGAAGIYVIFELERKHARKLAEMEKDMAVKERLVSLGRMASGMAHEIRNPLNAMSMSIQRLKREFTPEKERKEEYDGFLDIVRGELLRVNKIVEEFLLSTKANAPMEQHDLRAIVEEVATMLREKAHAGHVEIVCESGKAVVLSCQKERLKQVFYNIFTNGIEAMPGGGTVQVSMALDNPHARILIRDTGPGVKKEDLLKIFEYYYTTKDKGMGLGLPISYMIVKDHGGDIKVHSEEGKGTTFAITLPVKSEG